MPAQLATVIAVEKRAERAYGTVCRDVTCAGWLYAALTTGAPVVLGPEGKLSNREGANNARLESRYRYGTAARSDSLC
jgi:hypothetical protein